MSLSAVSSASPFATSGLQTDYKKARADFKALSSALQSNDLTGAQGALAALKQDVSTSVAGVPHHHHRHHYGAGNSSTTPASGAAPATSGSVINLQA